MSWHSPGRWGHPPAPPGPPDHPAPPAPPWAPGISAPDPHTWHRQDWSAERRMRRRERKQTSPPPWWPDNEPWPPKHWKQHENKTRSFLNRIGCIFAVIVGLMIAMGGIGALFSGGDGRHGGPPTGFLMFLLIIGAVIVIGRTVRRAAAPIADVMAAADRVAEGDYTVRVTPGGGKDVSQLVTTFNSMTERLQANEQQRRNLFADVAHEMRTPLTVIRGIAEGMMDGVYPRDDDRLQTLLDETELMTRLLDDLRTLSLADAGVLTLHQEQVEVAELVDDLLSGADPRARASHVTLSASVAALEPVRLDPVRIRQTLENLLGNALRHTPPGGRVSIDVRLVDCDVVFTVSDTGKGIPPEYLPHIFDRFWKSADSGGSGLGLAIARGLVEAHGGGISAASTPGQGTTVRFTLPGGEAAYVNPRCLPAPREHRIKITRAEAA